MSIARYENIKINSLTFSTSAFGEQATTSTLWFETRATVSSVSNSVTILDKYRLYEDLINFTINYTPNSRLICDQQNVYSIEWRGNKWRIDSVKEADDKMTVKLLCYKASPITAV